MTWTAVAPQSSAWVAASLQSDTWTNDTADDQLFINSVSPDFGVSGTLVTITGENFTGVTSVTIDDLEASFTISDDSTILATVP